MQTRAPEHESLEINVIPNASGAWRPRTCVWELTLACNCHCVHCGSSAGTARESELTTEEALRVIEELRRLGCESITLSGGEPLMRPDWPLLGRAIRAAGIGLEMITNGLCAEAQADAIAKAGFFGVTFSVDGPAAVHDELRGVPGAFQRLMLGAQALKERNVRIGAVTQINKRNLDALEELHDCLLVRAFDGWQWQLTMPAGRAREFSDTLCLPPSALPEVERKLLAIRRWSPLFLQAADNIGYMSPNEPLLRTCPGEPMRFWSGCAAGLTGVGITSDGNVRGCLAQPPEANEGNLRRRTLTEIWHDAKSFAYNRKFDVSDLRGACETCAFGRICRGGCTSLAWAVSPENPRSNHYCLALLTR
jgi:radical SAM protein with 4Fe4S-binding SPASM domain